MTTKKEKIRVLVGSIPLTGHYIPLIRIAEALNKSDQFEIAFATSDFIFKKIKLSQSIKKFELNDQAQTLIKQMILEQIPCHQYDQDWNHQVCELIQNFKPHVIIADFIAFSFIKMGKKFNIPTIVHFASPISVILSFLDFPTIEKSVSILGIVVNYNNILKLIIPKKIKQFHGFGSQLTSSLVIISSFFGIQKVSSLPPNFKMIGFTFERKISEQQIQGDLKDWIEEKKNKNIIYVSFGTRNNLSQRFINFLYEGLKKIDIAVIWSLRQGNIPEQNPDFYVRSWLPQYEIIQSKDITLVITHCGWGAISECIQGKKPMLCVPNFGDQTMNAKTILDKRLGLILRKQEKFLISPEIIDKFEFTHQELKQKIDILIDDPSYVKRLQKLKNIMMEETGGCDQVVKIVRNAANFGIDHLIDRDVERIQKTTLIPLFVVLFITIFLLIIWSTFSSNANDSL